MTKSPIKLYNLKYILIGEADIVQHTPRYVRWNDRTFERLPFNNRYQEVKVVDICSVRERIEE